MPSLGFSPFEILSRKLRLPSILVLILLCVVFLLIPIGVALLEGLWHEFLFEGLWRNMLFGPAILLYIVALQHPINQSLQQAIDALRGIIEVEDEEFTRLVQQATAIDGRLQAAGFALGATFGYLVADPWGPVGEYPVLDIYLAIANALMFGALSWIIVTSLATTRLQAKLHQLPMRIDLFNLKPFEPIARHSLFIALAFIGGCVLSALFLVNPASRSLDVASAVIYILLIGVAILVFFLSMRHTHRRLAERKRAELDRVRNRITQIFREVDSPALVPGNFHEISSELDLWLRYELRIRDSRTWPYNTAMLRTLFLSVLLPAVVSLAQRLVSSLLVK